MIQKKIAVVSLMLGLASVSAHADFYGALKASYLTGLDDFDDEQTFGLTVGYDFNDKHALEFELQVNGFDSMDPGFEVDADVFTYLLNYNYTFWQDGKWSTRVGAGIGFADPEFGLSEDERGDDSIFVYQVGAGADYQFSDSFSAIFDVRLQDFGDMSDGDVTYDLGSPGVVSVGLRYDF